MKFLIAGLGNMGAEYDRTRHNVGFEVVERLAKVTEVEFDHEQQGDLARIKHKGRTLLLLKPSTYMNRSGKAIRYWMTKEKIKAPNILVIVDDLNLPIGRLRLRGKGSDGGHNGLKDIIGMIGKDFARLRIGIGREFSQGRQSDYVLGEWTEEEKEEISPVLQKSAEAVLSYVSIGLNHTMDRFNN